jgi:hypothetical protein
LFSLNTTNSVLEFLDGTTYSSIWSLNGTQSRPLLRIYIDKYGVIKVYGSRTSGGLLEEMRLRNGSFNTITLNTNSTNTFQLGQVVVGQTFISGDYGIVNVPLCDYDNDGIPNGLDLDSDGDGCSDAIEAASSSTADSTTAYPTGTDSNGNGLLNTYEGLTTGTISYTSTYTANALARTVNGCLDSDGDSVNNSIDIDDDNDGIIDQIEQIDCVTKGKDIASVAFSGSAVTAKTATSITSSNTNSWISSYSSESFTLPVSLKFKRPVSGNTAMIGLLPTYATQSPATWSDGAYKFYFLATNVSVPYGTSWNVSQAATASDEYSIDISISGYVTIKINGVQKVAFQGTNSDYKLAVSGPVSYTHLRAHETEL